MNTAIDIYHMDKQPQGMWLRTRSLLNKNLEILTKGITGCGKKFVEVVFLEHTLHYYCLNRLVPCPLLLIGKENQLIMFVTGGWIAGKEATWSGSSIFLDVFERVDLGVDKF